MFKANKLLKVMSVIMIVLGVLNLISTMLTPYMFKQVEEMGIPGMDEAMAQVTPLAMAISVLLGVIFIVCGVLAFMGKLYKVALVGVILILLYQVYSTVSTAASMGFSFISIFGFVIPILYLWGLYQSKE